MTETCRIFTAPSSATAAADCAGNVLISGSYGGPYNAYHAAKWGLRGVVLNDAGVGKRSAGIRGLSYLDLIGLPAAAADANTCHIGDADHMLEFGIISFVNRSANDIGCRPGETVRRCAERMCSAPPVKAELASMPGGGRYFVSQIPGEPAVVCLDAAPSLLPSDAGSIVVTGSHAALFRGRPDNVINVDVRAIFFSDAGVGLDGAGIARLPTLDARNIAAGTASAESAAIGDSRSIFEEGVLSHVNETGLALGLEIGMPIRTAVGLLVSRFRKQAQ